MALYKLGKEDLGLYCRMVDMQCVGTLMPAVHNKMMEKDSVAYPVWDTSGLVYMNMCRNN